MSRHFLLTFSFYCSAHHRHLHSFPTRRSSDLSRLASLPTMLLCKPPNILPCRTCCNLPPALHLRIVSKYIAGSCSRRRSEEHTSELQSHVNLVCRLLLEKKKTL